MCVSNEKEKSRNALINNCSNLLRGVPRLKTKGKRLVLFNPLNNHLKIHTWGSPVFIDVENGLISHLPLSSTFFFGGCVDWKTFRTFFHMSVIDSVAVTPLPGEELPAVVNNEDVELGWASRAGEHADKFFDELSQSTDTSKFKFTDEWVLPLLLIPFSQSFLF